MRSTRGSGSDGGGPPARGARALDRVRDGPRAHPRDRRRRLLRGRAGRGAGQCRRHRLGQVGDLALGHGAGAEPAGPDRWRGHPARGPGPRRPAAARAAGPPRGPDRDDLPGPEDLPRSGLPGGRPDGAGDPPASRHAPRRGTRARPGCSSRKPTTALGVNVEAPILRLVEELQAGQGMGTVLITTTSAWSSGGPVLSSSRMPARGVETAAIAAIRAGAVHPSTQALRASRPTLGRHAGLKAIPGRRPYLANPLPGCHFANRSPEMTEACRIALPDLATAAPGAPPAQHRTAERPWPTRCSRSRR